MNIIDLNQTRVVNPFPAIEDSELVFPVVKRDLGGKDIKTGDYSLPVDNHVGVYRAINGKPVNLGVVGTGHKFLHNESAFRSAENAFLSKLTPAQLSGAYVNDRLSFNGAWTEREYRFPSIGQQAMRIGIQTTALDFSFAIRNSYNSSSALYLVIGFVDTWCSNGNVWGTMADMVRRKHTAGLNASHVGAVVDKALLNLQEEIRRLQVMGNSPLTTDQAYDFFNKAFSERRAKRMIEQFEQEVPVRGNNVWALFSAMTFFASHDSDMFPVRANTHGQDNVAASLAARKDEIVKITNGKAFQDLLIAA